MQLKAFVSTATVAAFAFVLSTSAPASAKGGPKGPKPKAAATTHGKPGGAKAPKGSSSAFHGAKSTPGGGAKAAKSSPGVAKAPKGSGSGKNTGTTPGTPGSAFGNGGPTSGGFTLNRAQQQLMKNTNLRDKMQAQLGGADPIAAASDFRNLGQFVAAVNASTNQGYNFAELKALMTGPDALSLGQAKKRLRAGGGTSPGPIPPAPGTVPAPGPAFPGTPTGPEPNPGTVPAPGPGFEPAPSAGVVPSGTFAPSGTTRSTKTKSKSKTKPQ
jgi:hypothetical protein